MKKRNFDKTGCRGFKEPFLSKENVHEKKLICEGSNISLQRLYIITVVVDMTSEKNGMDEILKFKVFNKLKSVYRFCSLDDRKESTAEHSWACIILADYLLSSYDFNLDRLKVYELLMYHDVVEIKTGDLPFHPDQKYLDARANKKHMEFEAAKVLNNELPNVLKDKYYALFIEFEENKTKEAKFAKIVDFLEAQIHELDYKKDWKGWTKEFLIDKRLKYFNEFPKLKQLYLEMMDYLEENGYFNQ